MWTSEIRRLLEAQLVLMKGRTNLTCVTHQPRSLATPSFSMLHAEILCITLKNWKWPGDEAITDCRTVILCFSVNRYCDQVRNAQQKSLQRKS